MTHTNASPTEYDAVAGAYLRLWSTTDADERLALLRSTWAEDARYVDPLADVTGHEEINALIGQVQQQFAGMSFTPVGEPDGHHDQVRFRWGLGPAGGDPIVIGFDVVVLDESGLVRDVRGFLDLVPS